MRKPCEAGTSKWQTPISWLLYFKSLTDILLLCFASIAFFFFFTNWRFVATLHRTSYQCQIFQRAFIHFVPLCHILVILEVFQALVLLLRWTVISDLWCYSCNLFWHFFSTFSIKVFFFLRYNDRERVMDREAWSAVFHGVATSRTRLNNNNKCCCCC